MNEENKKNLDFSLPERSQTSPSSSGLLIPTLLVLLLALVGMNLYLTSSKDGVTHPHSESSQPTSDLKKLALKLEKQGLNKVAAEVWYEYLETYSEERPATIWYRIATLQQKADNHEEALAAFYRAESITNGEELSSDIGRQVQDSLDALGKFSALQNELRERVGLNENSGSESDDIVAEIGPQKITRVELDRQIEANIENQLSAYAGQLSEEQRKQQKEAMVKQFSGDQQRMQFLNGYIVQEILYRKARESKLIEDPKVRAQLRDAERSLLARQLMESELSGRAYISDSDISTYYDARKKDFLDPAKVSLSYATVSDEEAAKKMIAEKKLGDLQDAELVKGRSLPGFSPNDLEPLFNLKVNEIHQTPIKSDKDFHVFKVRSQTPERQRTLDEVRAQIQRQMTTQKERELQRKLLEDLKREYDVVIHHDAFNAPNPE